MPSQPDDRSEPGSDRGGADTAHLHRGDLLPAEYEEPPTADIVDALLDALREEEAPLSYREAPSFTVDDLGQDLRWELERLRSARITRAVAIDLTRREFEIPVVRIVIPGLEGDIRHPHYTPGERALRAAQYR